MDIYRHTKSYFYKSKIVKNTTTTFHPKPRNVKAFPSDERICPVRTIVHYIKRTERFRGNRQIDFKLP